MTATTITTLYIVCDAEYDLAESNQIPGWSDLSDEVREEVIEVFTAAYLRAAKRLYGDHVDVLTDLEADMSELERHWGRNTDEHAKDLAREAWQRIHDHVGIDPTKPGVVTIWIDESDRQHVRTS